MTEIAYHADEHVHATREQLASWTVEGGHLEEFATGPCPTCRHVFEVELELNVVTNVALVEDDTPPARSRATRRFDCECSEKHPDRPADVTQGCGRWWLASVVRRGRIYHLIPADDARLAAAAKALDDAAKDQTGTVRAWGEKWLPAGAALYGLLGAAGVLISKDSVKDLSSGATLVAAALVVVVVAAAAISIYYGYRAAFGWMKVSDVSDDAKLMAWYEERRAAVVEAPRQMGKSLAAAGVSIAGLVLGILLVWLGPSGKAASPVVDVAYNATGNAATPATACGSLLSSKDGQVIVQVSNGSTKESVVIQASWVTGVSVKASC